MKNKMTDKTLPFKLPKQYKIVRKYEWKKYEGLICNDEDFELIYEKYIYSTNCDLCNIEFEDIGKRSLYHETGASYNIICNSCNQKKYKEKWKKKCDTEYKTKYKHIYNIPNYALNYAIFIDYDGERKLIEWSKNLDYIIKFRDNWLKENNYYT